MILIINDINDNNKKHSCLFFYATQTHRRRIQTDAFVDWLEDKLQANPHEANEFNYYLTKGSTKMTGIHTPGLEVMRFEYEPDALPICPSLVVNIINLSGVLADIMADSLREIV